MKTHKILLDKKFVLKSAITIRLMFFNVFYLFSMALFLLVGVLILLKIFMSIALKIVLKGGKRH
nr:hypothetical protein [Helicobacter pylori]